MTTNFNTSTPRIERVIKLVYKYLMANVYSPRYVFKTPLLWV